MGGVAWSEEEDHLLKKCIEQYGEGKWHRVPVLAGLNRCRKSCRLRWLNYLRPNIRRGSFTDDEVLLIIKLHSHLGNRWSLIASRLPGRTANDVKNYWNCHLSKKLDKLQYNDNILTSLLAMNNPANFAPQHNQLQAIELVRGGEALMTNPNEGEEMEMHGVELGRSLSDGTVTSTKCAKDENDVDEFESKFELEDESRMKAGGQMVGNMDNIWDWDELIFDMDLW